jgi:hypothetical protein
VLATLIAGDLKSLTVTSLSFRTAEVCAPCVAAWLTSLRVSQVTFPVILLFPFREHERSAALRTHYFKVWHTRFLHESENEVSTSLALRSAGVAFLSTTDRGTKALFSQTHAEKLWRPDGLLDLSVLQQLSVFKFFRTSLGQKLWQNVFTSLSDVACLPHRDRENFAFQTAQWLLAF